MLGRSGSGCGARLDGRDGGGRCSSSSSSLIPSGAMLRRTGGLGAVLGFSNGFGGSTFRRRASSADARGG